MDMAQSPVTNSAPAAGKTFPFSGARLFENSRAARLFKKNRLKIINAALALAIVLAAAYFVTIVRASVRSIENVAFTAPVPSRSRLARESALLKELAFYLESVQQRDIFTMGPKKPADNSDEIVSSAAVEATKSLRLVGISWSDNPDAIIEDERTKTTYFVKKGGMVGDVKVESIFREKVILKVGQEAIELR